MSQNVKLKLSVVGVGNAGCQAVQLAKDHNHNVFAINSSEKDLNDTIVDKSINAVLIGNKRGAGKNRTIAKEFLKEELKSLFNNSSFLTVIEPADVVVIVGSTAGGTGSGIGPLLANRIQVTYPGKICIFFGVLPKHSESAQSQFNALECVNEASHDSLKMPYILADLNRFEDDANDVAYKKMSEYIVDCLDILRGDLLVETPYGMIDESDLLTILAEPGYMTIHHLNNITQKKLEEKSTQEMLIESIKTSPAVMIQKDGIVHKMGFMINTPEQVNDPCKSGDFSLIQSFVGFPLDTFLNYSVSNTTKGNIGLIMSGLSKPIDRLSECTAVAKRFTDAINKKDNGSVADEMASVIDVKKAQNDLDRNKVIGLADERAVSAADIASDIPDIF